MLTKQIAIKKVKQFLNECQQLPFTIDKAIVFGSVAKGKIGENSDIDLALFSKNFSNNILKNLDLFGTVNIRFPEIDVHTYATAEYNKHKGVMIEQIKQTGIEIKMS